LKRPCRALAALILAAGIAGAAAAEPVRYARRQNFLDLGLGGRAAAMGSAQTAWAEDVYGMNFNPAGIARLRREEIGLLYHRPMSEMGYSFVGYAHPLRSFGGTIGASFSYFDLGTVPRTTVSSGFNSQSTGTAGAHDWSLALTFARPAMRNLDYGVTLKYVSETLDRYTAGAVLADLGARWHVPYVSGLDVGLSITNMGSSLKFVTQAEHVPITVRLGAGLRPASNRWGWTTDLLWADRQPVRVNAGGEYWLLANRFALRAGYDGRGDAGTGFTTGAGFRFADLAVDYALAERGDLDWAHHVTLTYDFGMRPPGSEATAPESARTATPTTAVARSPATGAEPSRTATLETGVFALPFRYVAGPPELDWIESAIPEVLHHNWRKSRRLAASADAARFTLEGDFRAQGELVAVNARLKDRGNEIERFQWRGEASRIFDMFASMVESVNERLASLPY
jgi:hypothetical protein